MSSDQIIIASSTEQLLNMVTDLLKDSSFIIEQPSYPPIKHVLDKHRISYTQARVEKDGINIDEVFQKIMIFYISHHLINFQQDM